MKPWMMNDEWVSPQCCLPIMTMIGFGGSLAFYGLFEILIKGRSKLPFDVPSVSNFINP